MDNLPGFMAMPLLFLVQIVREAAGDPPGLDSVDGPASL